MVLHLSLTAYIPCYADDRSRPGKVVSTRSASANASSRGRQTSQPGGSQSIAHNGMSCQPVPTVLATNAWSWTLKEDRRSRRGRQQVFDPRIERLISMRTCSLLTSTEQSTRYHSIVHQSVQNRHSLPNTLPHSSLSLLPQLYPTRADTMRGLLLGVALSLVTTSFAQGSEGYLHDRSVELVEASAGTLQELADEYVYPKALGLLCNSH